MSRRIRHILFRATVSVFLAVLAHGAGYAQMMPAKDTISHNSTCVNYKIRFGSSLFDRINFPDQIIWNFGDPASGFYNAASVQQPTHLYAAVGAYPVKLTVVNGGDSTFLFDTVNVVNPIAWNFGPDIFLCEKGDTVIPAPIVAGATYLWNDDSLTTRDTLHVTQSGVYSVQVNGCTVSDSIGVFFSQTPDIELGDDHVMCAGETLTLNAASQNGSYRWQLNGAVLPDDTLAQLVTTAPGGQYIATVTVPGCGVYADTANITYSATPAVPFSLGPDTLLCPKEIYTLNASVTGATAYDWSTKETSASIQVKTADTYWAFVTVNNDCQVVDSVIVTYRGDKNLDFHDTAICKGVTLVLDADFGIGTYNWTSDPPQRNDQDDATKQSTYYVYEPGLYKVTASVGQCSYTDSLHVSYNDSLDLDIGRDTSLCLGEEFILHVKTNANEFQWQDGSTSLDYSVPSGGTYTVIAHNGCGYDTASVKIQERHCTCDLTLPNAFTPNFDGHNDLFRPLHPCLMEDFRIRIFDRYGELVYESSDFSKGWNGTLNGTPVAVGSYVWIATYRRVDTHLAVSRKGFVVVLR